MNKNEFLEIRQRYRTDAECIKTEGFNKERFYQWKTEFGLSKRSKRDRSRLEELKKMSKEEFLETRKQYSSDAECANKLNIGLAQLQSIKKSLGLVKEYDHTEIDKSQFLELYNKGLNDQEIASKLNINSKKINNFRSKLGLPNNVDKHLEFTEEQLQIFLGGMLGDGSLYKDKNCINYYYSFAHSSKQKKYCFWKYEKLKNLCGRKPREYSQFDKRTCKYYERIDIRTYVNELFSKYNSLFYIDMNGKRIKYINQEILNLLDDLGVAVWFMDDGYKENNGYCISTNCFSDADLKLIVKFFIDKYDIYPTIHANHILYIGAKYKNAFTKIIEPYIHEELKYKLHNCPV